LARHAAAGNLPFVRLLREHLQALTAGAPAHKRHCPVNSAAAAATAGGGQEEGSAAAAVGEVLQQVT
jgi:hypothetical protein